MQVSGCRGAEGGAIGFRGSVSRVEMGRRFVIVGFRHQSSGFRALVQIRMVCSAVQLSVKIISAV